NVLLTDDGTPKITDFGLAKKLGADDGATRTGQVVGTPGYMAPEQAGGQAKQVGPAADVWALGAILYRPPAGRPPVQSPNPPGTILQVVSDEPIPLRKLRPDAPRPLETICHKCLTKDLAKRYATAAALADDVRRWRDGEPILARPPGPAERLGRWVKRNQA